MAKISVCIATYNGEKYIGAQLQSILCQLPVDAEIIISDDSSEDNTLTVVQSFNDARIRLLPNQRFRSPIFNFENALKHCTGDVIFLSDQDDLWHDNKIEKVMAAIETSDLVLTDCNIIDADGGILEGSFFKVNGSGRGFIKNLYKNSYLGCCLAFRSEVLKKALPFPSDIPMHDWWIGSVSEVFFKITIINEPLISYRRHGINATPTGEISNFPYFERIKFRYALIKGLCKVWLK